MGFGKIVAQQVRELAAQAEAGVFDPGFAREAAEQRLAALSEPDRREAEAILSQNASRR